MALHGFALPKWVVPWATRPNRGTGATSPQAVHKLQQRRPAVLSSSLSRSRPKRRTVGQGLDVLALGIGGAAVAAGIGGAAVAAGSTEEVAGGDELKLLGTWRSPFALRVRLALNFKGLCYKYLEEDLSDKSDLLLNSNPVNKMVPVLIHNGVPICESLAILEYIDEVYSTAGPSLLPADPYERAIARFWAAYIDNKLVAPWWKMFMGKTDEEKAGRTKQTFAAVEALEGALKECSKGKPFFGGDNVGYVDVTLGGMVSWMKGTEALCGVELLDVAKTPLLLAWMGRFSELDAAKVVLPDVGRLVEFAKMKRTQKTLI